MPEDCSEEWLNKFNVYDQAVDIVSCWETAMKHIYSGIFNDYYFERFPSIPQGSSDDPVTPDFTIYFNDEYGIVGEIKRTFPDDDVAFNSTLNQLANYDRVDLELMTADGSRDAPQTVDIVLLISGSSAPQIGTRIHRKRSENIVNFNNNLVLLRYQYNSDATFSRYEFQRVSQVEDEFRDHVLPEDISLSNQIGESGDYGTMEVYPKHFSPTKTKKPLCNDSPPEPYLATILWHKVFPEFLNADEYRQWREGTAQKRIFIKQSVDDVWNELNDYMKEGTARKQWVEDSLDYLCTARLAEKESGDYEIGFRDLVQQVGDTNIQEGTQILEQTKELAYMFVDRYCKYTDEEDDSDEGSQSSLGDFY